LKYVFYWLPSIVFEKSDSSLALGDLMKSFGLLVSLPKSALSASSIFDNVLLK